MESRDRNQPEWAKQPGLLPDKDVERHSHYDCGEMRAQPPCGLDHVLPTFMAHDPSCQSTAPQTEYILIALDFKYLCLNKIGKYADGREYRFKPLTEIGIASLDMRKVISGRHQGVPPGDRGSSWFPLMSPLHYVVEEYQDHWGHLCQYDGLGTETFLYAFGKSKVIPESAVVSRLQKVFQGLQTRDRTPDEVRNQATRKLIILAFGAASVETTLGRLGLSWPSMSTVEIIDVQEHSQARARFASSNLRLEYVMESLGLRFHDNNFGNISHCAGNTAVFTIQIFLALFYKTQEQSKDFDDRAPVSWLPFTWVAHTLDQANIAPGSSARARQQQQMNRNEVPQKKDPFAFS